jgi:hypothetical protein
MFNLLSSTPEPEIASLIWSALILRLNEDGPGDYKFKGVTSDATHGRHNRKFTRRDACSHLNLRTDLAVPHVRQATEILH